MTAIAEFWCPECGKGLLTTPDRIHGRVRCVCGHVLHDPRPVKMPKPAPEPRPSLKNRMRARHRHDQYT